MRPELRPPLNSPGVGDLFGSFNGAVDWNPNSIVDKEGHYEIALRLLDFARSDVGSVDVTPRRTQAFKPRPGAVCEYAVRDVESGKVLASGQSAADAHGRVTVERCPVTKKGVLLAISLRK